jgi:thioredoxin 1
MEVTEATFDDLVTASVKPVLVYCWAPWCTNCKRLAPALDELTGTLGDTWSIVAINIEENPALAVKLKVLSLPTVLTYLDGAEVGRLSGPATKSKVMELMQRAMSPTVAAPPSTTARPSVWARRSSCS